MEHFLQVIDQKFPIDEPRSIGPFHDLLFLWHIHGRDVADEVLENIVKCDQSLHTSVLVNNERHVSSGFLEQLEQL